MLVGKIFYLLDVKGHRSHLLKSTTTVCVGGAVVSWTISLSIQLAANRYLTPSSSLSGYQLLAVFMSTSEYV